MVIKRAWRNEPGISQSSPLGWGSFLIPPKCSIPCPRGRTFPFIYFRGVALHLPLSDFPGTCLLPRPVPNLLYSSNFFFLPCGRFPPPLFLIKRNTKAPFFSGIYFTCLGLRLVGNSNVCLIWTYYMNWTFKILPLDSNCEHSILKKKKLFLTLGRILLFFTFRSSRGDIFRFLCFLWVEPLVMTDKAFLLYELLFS